MMERNMRLIKRLVQILGFIIMTLALLSVTRNPRNMTASTTTNQLDEQTVDDAQSHDLRAASPGRTTGDSKNARSRLGMPSADALRSLQGNNLESRDDLSPQFAVNPRILPTLKLDSNINFTASRKQQGINSKAGNSSYVEGDILPFELIGRIRAELKEMRESSNSRTLRAYNHSSLPRELTLLGKSIFRLVPSKFLDDYRSPCFNISSNQYGMACLPRIFLAGFPKCATTDLFKKLVQHPDVVETSKEPHWWTRTTFSRASVLHYLNRQSELVKRINASGNKRLVTLDASASTIWDNKYSLRKLSSPTQPLTYNHIEVMRAVLPDARFVVIVREPTERLYSGYMAFDDEWRLHKSPRDFHNRLIEWTQDFGRCMARYSLRACAYLTFQLRVNVGMYSIFIRDWLERYPRDQLHILRTEDWARNSSSELDKIFRFLKLSTLSHFTLSAITSSTSENRRSSTDSALGGMLPESKRLLDALYRPFNEDLADLMGDMRFMWKD